MNEKATLRNQCDRLWKEICLRKYGTKCEICGENFRTTPHHFYYRSSIPWLRYEILNGIILCQKCHALLHFKDPKIIEEKIIKIRGKKWLNKLNKIKDNKPRFFKTDLEWYEKKLDILKKLK